MFEGMPSAPVTHEMIAAASQRLPTAPRVFQRLRQALMDPFVGLDEIVSIVRTDASLSAAAIRLANSPVFSRGGGNVASLDEALGRIGLGEVYRLVGAAMSGQLFMSGLPLYRISGDELWANSLATAAAASLIAREAGADEREAYTLGLLRPVGRLVLQRVAIDRGIPPFQGARAGGVDTESWELSTFGTTHAEVSARLFLLWGFGDRDAQALRCHGSLDKALAEGEGASRLHLACWIADTIGHGFPCDRGLWNCETPVCAAAGLSVEQVRYAAELCGPELARLQELVPAAAAA
jgi:HD-like signal output (HDOD) protein